MHCTCKIFTIPIEDALHVLLQQIVFIKMLQQAYSFLVCVLVTSQLFWKVSGGIEMGSVAISGNLLPYILVAIKVRFLPPWQRRLCFW